MPFPVSTPVPVYIFPAYILCLGSYVWIQGGEDTPREMTTQYTYMIAVQEFASFCFPLVTAVLWFQHQVCSICAIKRWTCGVYMRYTKPYIVTPSAHNNNNTFFLSCSIDFPLTLSQEDIFPFEMFCHVLCSNPATWGGLVPMINSGSQRRPRDLLVPGQGIACSLSSFTRCAMENSFGLHGRNLFPSEDTGVWWFGVRICESLCQCCLDRNGTPYDRWSNITSSPWKFLSYMSEKKGLVRNLRTVTGCTLLDLLKSFIVPPSEQYIYVLFKYSTSTATRPEVFRAGHHPQIVT